MIAVCRTCRQNTDRVWVGVPGRTGVPLCKACQELWEGSKEKQRADGLVKNAKEHVTGSQQTLGVLLQGIVSRAMQDFLTRVSKERLETAGKAVEP